MSDPPKPKSLRHSHPMGSVPKAPQHREDLFVIAYCETRNVVQAAIAAGYSEKTAHIEGGKLLKKQQVRDKVRQRIHLAISPADITPERMSLELARVAFSDIRKMYDEKGDPLHPKELDDDTAAAVSEIETGVFKKKVKLLDKLRAIDLLGKFMQLGAPLKIEHSGRVQLTDVSLSEDEIRELLAEEHVSPMGSLPAPDDTSEDE